MESKQGAAATPPASAAAKPRRAVSEITIATTETRRDGSGNTFTVYQIVVKMANLRWAVYRRYSQFERLHSALVAEGFGGALAKGGVVFPGKYWVGSMNKGKVSKRSESLVRYLQMLVSVEEVLYQADVATFFGINTTRDSADGGDAAPDNSITEFGWVHRTGGLRRNTNAGGSAKKEWSNDRARSDHESAGGCAIL